MRVVVRVIAALLGLALAGAGILLIVEVIGVLLRPGGLVVPWSTAWTTAAWNDARTRAAAGILVVAGLILLLLAFVSGRRDLLLRDPAPDVSVATDRGSLARLVGRRVRAEDGVTAASVSASGTRVRVKATGYPDPDLHARLSEAATAAVRELPLRHEPTVSISVSEVKERR